MITLISPRSPFLIDDKEIPQLGLMYIYSYLKKEKIDVTYLDMTDNPTIPNSNIYAITGTVAHVEEMKKIVKQVRSKSHNSIIIAGGSFISTINHIIPDFMPNYYIQGEGEKFLLHFIKNLSDITRTSEYKKTPTIIKSDSKYISKNIDEYPSPCWDLLKGYSSTISHNNTSIRGAAMITSRGCCHNCSFCASPFLCGRKVRFHSVSYVIKQVKWLLSLGYEGIYFLDDTITLNKKRLVNICKEMKKIGIPWRCFSRTDTLNPELLQIMKNAGCLQIEIGIESGSQEMLNKHNKGTNVNHNKKVINDVKESGIIPKLCYIVGLPGENDKTIEETKQFMKDTDTLCSVNVFVPYPGSDIYNNPDKYNYNIDRSIPFEKYQCRDEFTVIEIGKRKKIEQWRNELLYISGKNEIGQAVKNKLNNENIN